MPETFIYLDEPCPKCHGHGETLIAHDEATGLTDYAACWRCRSTGKRRVNARHYIWQNPEAFGLEKPSPQATGWVLLHLAKGQVFLCPTPLKANLDA